MAKSDAAQQFGQESFSEYHLYTLGRRTSIQNNESKQISLLSGSGVPVEKYLLVEGQQYWFRNSQGIGNPISQPVKVLYRFKNDEKSSLGMPLPAGTVRVYQADSKGGIQFVGEDRIDHTPKDETAQNSRRQRLRRGLRAQRDRLQENLEQHDRARISNHACAITKTPPSPSKSANRLAAIGKC